MTAIRNAFVNMIASKDASLQLIATIGSALERKPRLSRDQQRGWSTKISFRTYNSLKNQGVLD
ncbi:hypothetical protein [Burkholderia cepacia]|uniref:hypothetical protein n=1 Tax=Burkholderia cepacia TaxID=292 RepID=UPI001CF2937A|nr:hypothetical protein [Burkholderia cepacia]MCA8110273.1 hypothetical protein [Burkholderia cepacia]MCA8396572.1 hypothetical protein [Burkholderia cepacia]